MGKAATQNYYLWTSTLTTRPGPVNIDVNRRSQMTFVAAGAFYALTPPSVDTQSLSRTKTLVLISNHITSPFYLRAAFLCFPHRYQLLFWKATSATEALQAYRCHGWLRRACQRAGRKPVGNSEMWTSYGVT
jgi:hypothetical protein